MTYHPTELSTYSFDQLVDEYLQLNARYRFQIGRPVKDWNREKCEELKQQSEAVMMELENRRRVNQAAPSLV